MCQPLTPSPAEIARAVVVGEALTWLRTPWHHEARVKGQGVDCGQLLIAVYSAAGLVPAFVPEHYPHDWHLHRDEPRFLAYLRQFADPVETPQIADVAMFRFGRHAAHGAIVVSLDGPTIVHAAVDEGQVALGRVAGSPLADRLAGYFRLRGLA